MYFYTWLIGKEWFLEGCNPCSENLGRVRTRRRSIYSSCYPMENQTVGEHDGLKLRISGKTESIGRLVKIL